METKSHSQIGVMGLGKLGLPFVAAAASRGFRVVGYDVSKERISQLKRGEYHHEPGIAELLHGHGFLADFTNDCRALSGASLIFVVVPTPSRDDGSFSTSFLEAAFVELAEVICSSSGFPVIAVVSTVLSGDMEALRTHLEKESGKKCGLDFGLCYNPAFIALGNVIQNLLHPDFVLIGESESRSGEALQKFHMSFCQNSAAIHRMNFANAQIAKIALNAFVTMKISYGNMLARLCERIPDANADVVTKAIGDDCRIGRAYLKGAIGYGGPCFPRDNRAIAYVAQKFGLEALLPLATDRFNCDQIRFLKAIVENYLSKDATISVLGLSYKSDTDVIEESQGVMLAQVLADQGYPVRVYDPKSLPSVKKVLCDRVSYADSLGECLADDVIVITTPWREFSEIHEGNFKFRPGRSKVVIDCWKVLSEKNFSEKILYVPLGACLPDPKPVVSEVSA